MFVRISKKEAEEAGCIPKEDIRLFYKKLEYATKPYPLHPYLKYFTYFGLSEKPYEELARKDLEKIYYGK